MFGQNTATHRNGNGKQNIRILWKPPPDADDTIEFVATVVQSKSVFWTNLKSSPLEVKSGPQASFNGRPSAQQQSGVPETLYGDCDTKKLCFGLPANCVASKSCRALFKSEYDRVASQLLMELHGVFANDMQYFAVAISSDEKMGDDSVTECYKATDGTVKLRNSFNFGRSNQLDDIAIRPDYASMENGVGSCQWRRRALTSRHGKTFDLEHDKYYLLLAAGEISQTNDKKAYHGDTNRIASASALNLTVAGSVDAGARLQPLTKAHGL